MNASPVPYENQLIAAFVFRLGFAAAEYASDGRKAAVNLWQQTPLDPTFGDFVAGFSHCVAIEFKRLESEIKSEVRKWSRNSASLFLGSSRLQQDCREAHLIAFYEPQEGDLQTCCYAKAFDPRCSDLEFSAAELIERICLGSSLGLPPAQLETYLVEVARLKRRPPGGPGGGPSGPAEQRTSAASWLAVAYNRDGSFALRCASSLEELLVSTPAYEIQAQAGYSGFTAPGVESAQENAQSGEEGLTR